MVAEKNKKTQASTHSSVTLCKSQYANAAIAGKTNAGAKIILDMIATKTVLPSPFLANFSLNSFFLIVGELLSFLYPPTRSLITSRMLSVNVAMLNSDELQCDPLLLLASRSSSSSSLLAAGAGGGGAKIGVGFSGGGVWKYAPNTTNVTGIEQLPAATNAPFTGCIWSCNACWNGLTHATINDKSAAHKGTVINSLNPSQNAATLFLNRRHIDSQRLDAGAVMFPLGKPPHSSFRSAIGSGEPTPGAVGKGVVGLKVLVRSTRERVGVLGKE